MWTCALLFCVVVCGAVLLSLFRGRSKWLSVTVLAMLLLGCLSGCSKLTAELRARQRRSDLTLSCQMNLKLIYIAVKMYENDHGAYPQPLRRIVSPKYGIDARHLRCPRVVGVEGCKIAYGGRIEPEYIPTGEMGTVARQVSDERLQSMPVDYAYHIPAQSRGADAVLIEEIRANHSIGFSKALVRLNILRVDGSTFSIERTSGQ